TVKQSPDRRVQTNGAGESDISHPHANLLDYVGIRCRPFPRTRSYDNQLDSYNSSRFMPERLLSL
ncbi:Hypothetical predicted protein, partial [Pelobates cultripes]